MADLPSWPELTITTNGAIAEVRMSREARRNALSVSLMGQLTEAALALGRRTDIHAVILTGAATYFSAGADLSDPLALKVGPP
jgi:enoyl-CoA hydratase/carnithine racemase